jgi:thiol-disulfide isomerase/thioredoxin
MQSKIIPFLASLLFLLSTQAIAESTAKPPATSELPRGIIPVDGRDAPDLILNDINGETYDISKHRGKWIFMHFWASWCGPCRREMPTIQAISSEFKDSGLSIVLVNTSEDEDTVFDFLGTVAPDMNTLLDSDGTVTERWQPRGLPSTWFVDPEGKLRYIALGGRPWDKGEYLGFLKGLIK